MARYGSDKPDRRLGLLIHDVSDSLLETLRGAPADAKLPPSLEGLRGSDRAIALGISAKGFGKLSRKKLSVLEEKLKKVVTQDGRGDGDLLLLKVTSGRSWQGGLGKTLEGKSQKTMMETVGGEEGDIFVMFVADSADEGEALHEAQATMGQIRLALADAAKAEGLDQEQVREEGVDEQLQGCGSDMFWVVDFPLFVAAEGEKGERLESSHHPFTAPAPGADKLLQEALKLRGEERREALLRLKAQHYDLVANGMELGGGSMR